ncbi:DinB family protein [Balneola sp. MJW-20]|uniref:DinB family protein n=1 Tax=Gracilimonas aurantiaca TaxID=3234185 RepID=UPI003467C8C2
MIRKLFEYDRDTNLMMLNFLEKQEGLDLHECFRHLSHIVWAQEIWLARIMNLGCPVDQWEVIPVRRLKEMLEINFQRFKDIMDGQDTEEIIHYTNSEEKSFDHKISDILQHVIIHGQHHRAQISLLLRQSGIKPPATDLIYYLRQP